MRHLFSLLFLVFSFGIVQAQNALHFDGTNDYLASGWSGILGSNARSVECWIRTPYVAGQEVILNWGTASTGQRFTFALIDGKVRVEVQGSGVTGPSVVGDSTWHHVAMTYDGSSTPDYRIYIDGSLDTSFNISTPINTGSQVDFRVGLRIDNVKYFIGAIDEIRVWDYARSASQISSNMNSEFCTQQTGLVAYHKFNHGIANASNTGTTTSNDVSTIDEDGTTYNFSMSGSTSNWVTGANLTRTILFGSDTLDACESYSGPSGKKNWTSSGAYSDTIQSAMACDSVVSVQLIILDTSHGYVSISRCNSFTTSTGVTCTNSGLYTDTYTNAAGCDSILFIQLDIQKTFATLSDTVCDQYTSPSGKYTWASTGTYRDTIPNAAGCDSIMIISLTVQNNVSVLNVWDCFSFTTLSGKNTYSTSGTYFDTIPNSAGCDSSIVINLFITGPTSSSISVSECSQYTSPSGKFTWSQSGTYSDTLTNFNGCDSIIDIQLTIGRVLVSENVTECDSYVLPGSGLAVTTSGTYIDSLLNSSGCDSIVTYNVDINTLDSSVTVVEDTISASYSAGTHRWFACSAGSLDSIVQLGGSEFVAQSSGEYAVEISDLGCMDTSACVSVLGVGLEETQSSFFRIFPNPSNGKIQILSLDARSQKIQIFNVGGQFVSELVLKSHELSSFDLPSGTYFLRSNKAKRTQKLVMIH